MIESPEQCGESRSASFTLPYAVLQGIHAGRELGEEMARLAGIENIKHLGGTTGIFTAGKLTSTSVYHQALCPFHNPIYRTDARSMSDLI